MAYFEAKFETMIEPSSGEKIGSLLAELVKRTYSLASNSISKNNEKFFQPFNNLAKFDKQTLFGTPKKIGPGLLDQLDDGLYLYYAPLVLKKKAFSETYKQEILYLIEELKSTENRLQNIIKNKNSVTNFKENLKTAKRTIKEIKSKINLLKSNNKSISFNFTLLWAKEKSKIVNYKIIGGNAEIYCEWTTEGKHINWNSKLTKEFIKLVEIIAKSANGKNIKIGVFEWTDSLKTGKELGIK